MQVYSILKARPVDVIDQEIGIYEYHNYQLSSPRLDGSVIIGSANYLAAHNHILKSSAIPNDETSVLLARETFAKILLELEQLNLIRQPPSQKRKTFKLVEKDT